MKKTIKIAFFGASVTQQSQSRTGEDTGYVGHAVTYLENALSDYEILWLQRGYGSNTLNDAGLFYSNEIVDWRPDFIIFEWHSTWLGTFSESALSFVVNSFLKTEAIIISLVLPLGRCIGKDERDNIKQTRWYQSDRFYQLNFYKNVSIMQSLTSYLRDEVHTNALGGKIYGDLVGDVVFNLTHGERLNFDDGEVIASTVVQLNPMHTIYKWNGRLDRSVNLNLVVVGFSGNYIQLFGKVLVGPNSPVLECRVNEINVGSVSIWDQWGTYERWAIKPITPKIAIEHNSSLQITITLSNSSPNYGDKIIDVDANERFCMIEDFFVMGGDIISLKTDSPIKKVLIFSNCHGATYKREIESSFSKDDIHVDYVVSYENLENYEVLKERFSNCDFLILQPIYNYPNFSIENIKTVVKKSCKILRIPFIRFDGFWPKTERKLKSFLDPAVQFFPSIDETSGINDYLYGDVFDEELIKSNFSNALDKLLSLENSGDIKFYNFFIENYQNVPLLRDSYHPTAAFFKHISRELVKILREDLSLGSAEPSYTANQWGKEFGHFKPIQNGYAKVLGLKYDLDSYFTFSRYDYLFNILNHEVIGGDIVRDLNDLQSLLQINVKNNSLHSGLLPEQQNTVLFESINLPKIFIVTPTFNSAAYLDETIQSVLSQEGDFELFYHIQDGHSSDETVEKILKWKSLVEDRSYVPKCKKITFSYCSEKDAGMYDAIVRGFSRFNMAPQDWMTWINSDDTFFAGAFKSVSKIDRFKGCDVNWVTGCASTTKNGVQIASSERIHSRKIISNGLADGKFWGFVQQEGTFFRNQLWKKIDPNVEFSNFKYAGDWNLWKKFAESDELYQFRHSLASFTIRPGQLSQVARSQYEDETYAVATKLARLAAFKKLDAHNINSHYFEFDSDGEIDHLAFKPIINHYKFRCDDLKKIDLSSEGSMRERVLENAKPMIQVQFGGSLIIYDHDWQYPAITEQHAYHRMFPIMYEDASSVYIAFPWATLIDLLNSKKTNTKALLSALEDIKKLVIGKKNVVTVCQHILMLNYQNMFAEVGVTDVFWTHAIRQQSVFPKHGHISIHPFPLYPVQVNDASANEIAKRKHLYSFVGAKSNKWYLTQSRSYIIDLLAGDARGVVIGRDQWHYNKVVYEHQIAGAKEAKGELVDSKTSLEFQKILSESIFSLCPSGSGPNSIRLWESIGYGSIPVILADTYLPPGDPALWELAAVFCEETEDAIRALPDKLEALAKDTVLIEQKRHAMKQLWMLYGPDCFVYDVQKLFLSIAADASRPVSGYMPEALNSIAEKILEKNPVTESDANLFLTCCSSYLLLSCDSFLVGFKKVKLIRSAYIAAKSVASEAVKEQLAHVIKLKKIDLWGK